MCDLAIVTLLSIFDIFYHDSIFGLFAEDFSNFGLSLGKARRICPFPGFSRGKARRIWFQFGVSFLQD